jgi:hypothetical protein
MSVVELGTVLGTQFAAVFQSPLVGFVAHVALPAIDVRCDTKNSSAPATRNLSLLVGGFMRLQKVDHLLAYA